MKVHVNVFCSNDCNIECELSFLSRVQDSVLDVIKCPFNIMEPKWMIKFMGDDE